LRRPVNFGLRQGQIPGELGIVTNSKESLTREDNLLICGEESMKHGINYLAMHKLIIGFKKIYK
jgi:hypothetical protein